MTNKDTQPTRFDRTGQNTFAVTHDDGSVYHCNRDPKLVKFKGEGEQIFVAGEIRARNVMSNKDRKRLGLELDPDLEK